MGGDVVNGGSSESGVLPLAYASESTSEMRWVLRFVACYVGAAILAPFMVRQTQYLSMRSVPYWRDILYLLPDVLGLVVVIGVFVQRRVALWALVILPLCPPRTSFYVPTWHEAGLAWARGLAAGILSSALAWSLYRRAERAGALVPGRGDFTPDSPAGNDIMWLVRRVGIYALTSPIAYITAYLLAGLSTLRGIAPMDLPRSFVVHAITVAMVSAVAVPIAFGRRRMLLFFAAVSLVAPGASQIAFWWDIATSAKFRGAAGPSIASSTLVALTYGAATAVPLFVLYRRARREAN